ncbi:MAG: PP0621 family protein [Rhodoferax sp.]
MKVVLVLVVVLVGVWLWRFNRSAETEARRQKPSTQEPLEMVSCALCAVHVSKADAMPGKKGHYCCPEHRQRAEL